MGIAIPQVVTEDRASGALVIDSSLRFDESKGQYLKFTPSSSGNRRTQTLSVWIKNTYTGSQNKMILGGGDNASGPRHNIAYTPTKRFGITQNPTGGSNDNAYSVGVFRDYSGWQHLVVQLDCTVGQNSGQVRIYVNGKLQENGDYAGGGSAVYITDQDGIFNTANKRMYLGHYAANPSDSAEFDGYMAQYYWIDGLALGPKYFGYTDPLTGTWRPRKFRAEGTTLNDGTDWSGSTTNLSNGPNGFNGNLGNYAEVSSTGAKATVTFPKSIKVENSVTFWYSSGQPGNLFINDESTAMEVTGGFHQQDIEFTGTLSSVSIQSGSQPAIWGIAVDGTILESSVTQNLDFGTNGVYLPFDGSAPIGKDQSGKGNDYTPVNFGGSAALDKATGAKPILNTLGGSITKSGVFGSEAGKTYTVTAAGGKFYLDGSVNPALTSLVKGATYKFDTSDSSNDTHPFIFGTTAEGANYTDGVARSHNDGTTWGSSFVSSSGNFGVGDANTCFDGDITTRNGIDNSTGNGTLTLTVDFKNVHKVEVRTGIQNTLSINGGSVVATASADPQWITYEPGTSFNLTTITIACAQAGSNGYRVDCYGIKVDNVLLVNNVNDRYTKITVPHNVPNTFYYHCGVHSAMGNSISGSILDETKADPYAWKNVLAMPLTGNGADISNLVNCATSTKTITTGGSPAADNNSNFYHSATDFTASSSTGYYPTGAQSDFTFGTGDFTIEFWFKPTTTSRQYMTDFRNNGSGSGSGNNKPFVIFADNGSDGTGTQIRYANDTSSPNFDLLGGTGLPTSNTWHHLAIVRSSGTVYGYLDGALTNSATDNTNYSTNDSVTIGNSSGVSLNFDGSIQDYRIYNGVAKYTSNFIPASTNPDIALDTPSGVGTKPQLKKITDSNTLFVPTQASKIVLGNQYTPIDGTGDYTISFWFFASEYNSADNNGGDGGFDYILTQAATHPTYPIGINISKAGKIIVQDSANFGNTWLSTFDYEGSYNKAASIALGQWSYVHVVRSSGTLSIYNNGNLQYSRSQSSSSPTPTGDITICLNTGKCFVKDLRIEGAAITDATPPTSSPTATNNTRLLLDGLNDVSGNNVALTVTGDIERDKLSPFITSNIDTVRGQESGYATLNPLNPHNSNNSLSEGNLKFTSSGNDGTLTESTIAMSSGKYYFEVVYSGSQGTGQLAGIRKPGARNYNDSYIYVGTGNKYTDGGSSASYGATLANGDVIGTAYDADNGTLEFFKNGMSQGIAFTGITGTYSFFVGSFGSTPTGVANFGQRPFQFLPPDGFQPLTTSTIRPDTVISRPNQYIKTVTYTGNGASSPGGSGGTQTIDVGFKPDLIWIKDRTQTHNNNLIDSVNGAPNLLMSDLTNTLDTTSTDGVTAITNTGFTLGDNGSGTQSMEMNKSGNNYVAWTWKAGGGKVSGGGFFKDDVEYASAAAAGLTAGDTTIAGASVGTKQGFSIIKYTGPNDTSAHEVAHGLSQAPDFIITKNLDATYNWDIYHSALGDNEYLIFTTGDKDSGRFSGRPTSTVFKTAHDYSTNENQDYIAYCWHDVPGLQKFGSYESNSGGVFVELGFRPALLVVKNADAQLTNSQWNVVDTQRDTYNPSLNNLAWDRNNSEPAVNASTYGIDIISNGFAIPSGNTGEAINNTTATQTYVYMAWAESPFSNLYGAQSNAR